MAGRKLSIIREIVQQLLRDEFNPDETADWDNDEIDLHIESCMREVSEASPYKVQEILPLTANSKLLNIASIDDLIRIRYIEHTIGANPRNYRNFNYIDNETIEMGVETVPSTGCTAGTLAGTVTFTANSATVTGSGTAFSTYLAQNYYIKPSTKSRWYRIYSVESATSLTLDEPVKSGDAGADTINVTPYKNSCVAIAHCDKLHKLTETESTLNPKEESALILGVCGHAAISKARSLINKVNTGGGSTPQVMQSWGITKLQLYQQALRGFPPMVKRNYPTG